MGTLPFVADYFRIPEEQAPDYAGTALVNAAQDAAAAVQRVTDSRLPWRNVDVTRQAIYNWVEYWSPRDWRDSISMTHVWHALTALAVMPAHNFPDQVSYFKDHAALVTFAAGGSLRRFTMRPGKFGIKYLGLPQDCAESFANWWGQEFADSATVSAVVKQSRAPEEFARVYSMQCGNVREDFSKNRVHKALNTSCMQKGAGDFSSYVARRGLHPAYVYGSGDFEIWSLEYGAKLQARCVVALPRGRHGAALGPIYAVSRSALEKLDSALSAAFPDRGWAHDLQDGWEGCRLLHVPLAGQTVLAPYIDVEPRGVDTHEPGFMVLVDRSDDDDAPHASNTNGMCSDPDYWEDSSDRIECDHCSARVHRDDSVYVESCEYYVCESCFNAHYPECDHCGTHHIRANLRPVITGFRVAAIVGRVAIAHEPWCESCVEDSSVYCEVTRAYVSCEDIEGGETTDGEYVSELACYAGGGRQALESWTATDGPGRPAVWCYAADDPSVMLVCADVLADMRAAYENPELPLNLETQGV